tara:strand:+ start:241 stop:663 length:423 start_codon:yes stop_codon:yes gene_type:complete
MNNDKYKKVSIGKGKEKRKVPRTYLPKELSPADRAKQEKSLLEKKKRPKVESFTSKRSGYVKQFEEKYKTKITDRKFIHENILRYAGQDKIKDKGKGAYFSSGSRPNQNPFSWAYGRLASVIMGGPARKIDKKIWEKYKR